MTITADEFNQVVDEWKEWQSTPWGRLLYRVSQSNLARHLGQSPLRVLDVGGGNGTKGYFHPWFNRLTPLYSSAEMIGFLQTQGCKQAGDYGVLCVCAYLPNEPKYEAGYYSQLEQLELELTDQYPYKLLARFYQVVVEKQ